MRFVVIGNDQMLLSCLQHLQQRSDAEIGMVFYDIRRSSPANPTGVFCLTHGIFAKGVTILQTREHLSLIREYKPDVILSINNFWVLRREILDIPSFTTVNFHNASPDGYHGLNIPSWVIINGERKHGAMWHIVEEGIDTGDVLAWSEFDVTGRDTAASVMVRCIRTGIDLFPGLVVQLISGQLIRRPQKPGASYYGKMDYPDSRGYINFDQTGESISRLVRGLNYMPFSNPYLYAKIRHKGKDIIVNAVETGAPVPGAAPGTVAFIREDEVGIQCADQLITIVDAMDEAEEECIGTTMAETLGLKEGDVIG